MGSIILKNIQPNPQLHEQHMVTLSLTFWGTATLFSKVAAPFYILFFFFLLMIVTQRERERGRDIGRGRSRLHAPGTWRGIRSRVSRITPWAKGRRQTAAPPRDPRKRFFKVLPCHQTVFQYTYYFGLWDANGQKHWVKWNFHINLLQDCSEPLIRSIPLRISRQT